MGANVRYRSQYYNTTITGSGVILNTLEILDTEPVAQVINFESLDPIHPFEGLTENLEPGVYPSTLRFGMYIRQSAHLSLGKTYGPSEAFLEDLFTAREGRFLARHYMGEVLNFVGPILIDQCSYEDLASPYLLQITAADGLYRLQDDNYVSEIGLLKYRTCGSFDYTEIPIATCISMPINNQWTLIDHHARKGAWVGWNSISTYARYELYSLTSPGTGWFDMGNGLWVKAVPYTNEIITGVGGPEYRLTRDIDKDVHRNILEYFTRAIDKLGLSDEYPSPTVMFDTSSEWYETQMANFTSDPFSMARVNETPLLGKSWSEILKELCKTFNLRIYYAQGRYHFEQISLRDDATFSRFTYQADGTPGVTETASLDLNFTALTIKPETGGLIKILPPFKSVEITLQLENSNLLEDIQWLENNYGMRYIGRIVRKADVHKLRTIFELELTSSFDPALIPNSQFHPYNDHWFKTIVSIRITNVDTGSTYFLDPVLGTTETAPKSDGIWLLDGQFTKAVKMGIDGWPFEPSSPTKLVKVTYQFTSDSMPGVEGDVYDLHIGLWPGIEFKDTLGASYWTVTHPEGHTHNLVCKESNLQSLDANGNEIDPDVTRTYKVENDVNNSFMVKSESMWGDTGQNEKSIEVWDGTTWKRSRAWAIHGVGTTYELLALLANEIMSLRMLPRRLYSGTFVSSLPFADNRLQRATRFYLPLHCSKNTGFDSFQGEFLEIARTTVPPGGVVDSPVGGAPIIPPLSGEPGGIGSDPTVEPIPLTFETNADIIDESTITQVAIINTTGAFVEKGTKVTILDPYTGIKEDVYLSQDVMPDDVIMYFNSHHFLNGFPDASLIIPQVDEGQYPVSLSQTYYFHADNFSAIEIHAPNFKFVDPEQVGLHDINKRYTVHRNGIRNLCQFGAVFPWQMTKTYYFDNVARKWKFYGAGLVNEEILIIAW